MAVPLEVGTCGTIGSLLNREIEYFRRIEVESVENCMNFEEIAAVERNPWCNFKSFMVSWRRKKRRNRGIQPGICSMVDVAGNRVVDEIPGFGYRNLRADSYRFDV